MPKQRRPPFTLIILCHVWQEGPESHLAAMLHRLLDRARVHLQAVMITDPSLAKRDIEPSTATLRSIVEQGAVEQLTQSADCLITWGIPLDEYLPHESQQARIHVAFGRGDFSRSIAGSCHRSTDHTVCVSALVADSLDVGTKHTIIDRAQCRSDQDWINQYQTLIEQLIESKAPQDVFDPVPY